MSKMGKSGPDDKGHIRSNSPTSLRPHQANPSIKSGQTVVESKKKRTRTRLSPTERVYEDPEVAKHAFRAEREGNPFHRRAPTPYTSRSRRRAAAGSGSETGGEGTSGQESDSDVTRRTIERGASSRSVRSRVSFGSRTLRRNVGSPGSGGSSGDDEEDNYRIRPGQTRLGTLDPGFGSSRGIGPVGEAIEVIGLGRKQPRHRIFRREMLKPALRYGMSSRITLPDLEDGGPGGRGGAGGAIGGGRRNKPLPVRPGSIVSSVIDVLRNRPSLPPENILRRQRKQESIPPSSFRPVQPGFEDPLSPTSINSHESPQLPHRSNSHRSQENQRSPTEFPHLHSRTFHPSPSDWSPHQQPSIPIQPPPPPPPRSSLRSIWTSFSRNLHIDDPPFGHLRSRPRSPILLLPPAEDLFGYLATVYLAEWRDWPSASGEADRGVIGFLSTGRNGKQGGGKGWEWFKRMEVAEANRGSRVLGSWVGGDRFWGKRILDCKFSFQI